MKVTRIGLDIAKQIFELHGVDRRGRVVVRKTLRREWVLEYFSQLAACEVALEACGGAHYWQREIGKLGHTVRLLPTNKVKPYLDGNKNNAHDAAAICEQPPQYALGRAEDDRAAGSTVAASSPAGDGAPIHVTGESHPRAFAGIRHPAAAFARAPAASRSGRVSISGCETQGNLTVAVRPTPSCKLKPGDVLSQTMSMSSRTC